MGMLVLPASADNIVEAGGEFTFCEIMLLPLFETSSSEAEPPVPAVGLMLS